VTNNKLHKKKREEEEESFDDEGNASHQKHLFDDILRSSPDTTQTLQTEH